MIVTYPVEDMGKEVAEQALDEYLINGKSLREWISILSDELTILDKIRAEIEEEYGDCDICQWFEDYDYEENDISEYRQLGKVSDILSIIDKYREGGCVNVSIRK